MPSPWMLLLASALGGPTDPWGALPPALTKVWVEDALRQARKHGLEFVLVEALLAQHREGRLALEAPALASVEAARKVLLRRSLMWDQVLDEVLGLVDPEGSRGVLVLKGGGLRHLLYAEPATRELRDLDLLLPRDLLNEAMAAMEAAGWRQAYDPLPYDVQYVRNLGGLSMTVELHWGLDNEERCRLEWKDLAGQSLEVEAPGLRFRVPGLPHQALVALIHARKHVLSLPLKSVLDYKLVSEAMAQKAEPLEGGPEWALPGLAATHLVLEQVRRAWMGRGPTVQLPLTPLPAWHAALLRQLVDPWRAGYLRGVPLSGLGRALAVHALLVGPGPAAAREFRDWSLRRVGGLWSGRISS